MTWSLLEMARSLRTCPWGVLARSGQAWPAREAVDGNLAELRAPWAAIPAIGAPPGGATWMPLLGRVTWTSDPAALTHEDPLTFWMRVRLTDAFHAARVALLGRDGNAARMAVEIVEAHRRRLPFGTWWHGLGAMETALRAVRLLHVGALLHEACERHRFQEVRLESIALALAEHEAILRVRTDWRLHFTGNHHLIALAGTFLLAQHLPRTPARQRRARRAFTLFWRELLREVGPDGVHFESSTGYHLLAAETAAHVALIAMRDGLDVPRRARERLLACAAATTALARPDGTLAPIGDSDDGAFLDLAPSREAPAPLDARPALALLALATGHAGAAARALHSTAAREAAVWLGGSDAVARLESLAQETPAASRAASAATPACFPDGGLAILAAGGAHVTVSSTARGRAGTGGHGHDDAGAYELWLGGPLIVDRGTGAYARDRELRVALRGVASHAAIQIDGREMNGPPRGIFRREEWAKPLMTGWSSARGGSIAIGHHGFCRPPAAITVLRTLELSTAGELDVSDELLGSPGVEHEVTLRLPLAPGLDATALASHSARLAITRGGVVLATCEAEASGPGGAAPVPRVSVVPSRHAPRQHEIVAALTVEITWRLALGARVRHRVIPAAP